MENTIHYFIETRQLFDSIHEAQVFMKTNGYDPMLHGIGYHMPPPKYKAWVPNWLIKIITK